MTDDWKRAMTIACERYRERLRTREAKKREGNATADEESERDTQEAPTTAACDALKNVASRELGFMLGNVPAG